MSRLGKEIESGDPADELSWQITLRQLNKLVEQLRHYPYFQRLRAEPEGSQLPSDIVVWFVEPLQDCVLNILVEKTQQKGIFILTSNLGAAPVIRDILGSKLPPVRFAS